VPGRNFQNHRTFYTGKSVRSFGHNQPLIAGPQKLFERDTAYVSLFQFNLTFEYVKGFLLDWMGVERTLKTGRETQNLGTILVRVRQPKLGSPNLGDYLLGNYRKTNTERH
jgi:hypothetical protein